VTMTPNDGFLERFWPTPRRPATDSFGLIFLEEQGDPLQARVRRTTVLRVERLKGYSTERGEPGLDDSEMVVTLTGGVAVEARQLIGLDDIRARQIACQWPEEAWRRSSFFLRTRLRILLAEAGYRRETARRSAEHKRNGLFRLFPLPRLFPAGHAS